jgi:hypothetical protein
VNIHIVARAKFKVAIRPPNSGRWVAGAIDPARRLALSSLSNWSNQVRFEGIGVPSNASGEVNNNNLGRKHE